MPKFCTVWYLLSRINGIKILRTWCPEILNYDSFNISFTNAYCGTKILTYPGCGNIVRYLKAWTLETDDLVKSSLCHMPSKDTRQVIF